MREHRARSRRRRACCRYSDLGLARLRARAPRRDRHRLLAPVHIRCARAVERRPRGLRLLVARSHPLGRARARRGRDLDRAAAAADEARTHLVRQHGAGLLPARGRCRGGPGRPDRPESHAARRRDRHRADPVDRVRAQRGSAADPAARLRLVRGRGRLDPARHAAAVRAGPVGRGDARERDVGRPHPHPAPEGGDPPARDGGGRDPPHRRRGAAQRVRGPDAALRPRPALAREDRAADGLRGLGSARASRRGPRRARARTRRVGSPRALGAGAPRAQGERDVRLSRRASSRATSRSSGTASARASAPGFYTFLEMARDVGALDHVPELRFVREEVPA